MKRESNEENIKGNKNKKIEGDTEKVRLIPAIIQDYRTSQVLMLGYMSKESLKKSIQSGTTWFWSRERGKLWNKGETSGNIQKIVEIDYDCDGDALLIKVEQVGNACHTGNKSCFYRSLDLKTKNFDSINWDDLNFFYRYRNERQERSDFYKDSLKQVSKDYLKKDYLEESSILDELYNVLKERIESKAPGSYTYSLHEKGLYEIVKKVGEECIEVILSSKYQDKKRIISELADLVYHLILLMVEKEITLRDVFLELRRRRRNG